MAKKAKKKRMRSIDQWFFTIVVAFLFFMIFSHNLLPREASREGSFVVAPRLPIQADPSPLPILLPSHETTQIAYITFCHLASTERFETMIFPALSTWHPTTVPYYVVLLERWRHKWNTLIQTNTNFTRYASRIQPLFVDCPEGKFGESPCCKQEKGLLDMLDSYRQFDYYLFMDDDVYLRDDYLKEYLTTTSPDDVVVLVAGFPPKMLGHMGYLPQNEMQYYCVHKDENFKYPWGQPVIYTRAALRHVESGLRQGGLVKQCLEYNVTHDAGNALLHWMYQLDYIFLRVTSWADSFRNDFLGAHAIGRSSKYENDTSMEAVHRRYHQERFVAWPKKHVVKRFNTTGFQRTKTFKVSGDPTNWTMWHTMLKKDCLGRSNW